MNSKNSSNNRTDKKNKIKQNIYNVGRTRSTPLEEHLCVCN